MTANKLLPLLSVLMIAGCESSQAVSSSVSSDVSASESDTGVNENSTESENFPLRPEEDPSFHNVDIQKLVADKVSSSIKLATPSEAGNMPKHVDPENYHFFTYDYFGNLIDTQGNTSYARIFNKTTEKPENNYCAFLSINIQKIVETNQPAEESTLYIHLGGNFHTEVDDSYYIWDYNANSYWKNVSAENGEITIEYHNDSSDYQNPLMEEGHINLILFHFSEHEEEETMDVASCTEEFTQAAEYKDISYGDSSFETMDVSIPYAEGKTKLPVIVTIHGGYWCKLNEDTIYSKEYYSFLYDENGNSLLAEEGYIHVNLNYRVNLFGDSMKNVTEAASIQDMLDDINTALTLLDTDSRFQRADSDNLCLWGFSAGAQLAMSYAFNDKNTYKPKMIITEGGPSDLEQFFYFTFDALRSLIYALNGNYDVSPISLNISCLSAFSPAKQITRTPEFSIITHSENDNLVPFEQRQYLLDTGYFDDTNSYVPDVSDTVSSHREYGNIDWKSEYLPYLNQHLK